MGPRAEDHRQIDVQNRRRLKRGAGLEKIGTAQLMEAPMTKDEDRATSHLGNCRNGDVLVKKTYGSPGLACERGSRWHAGNSRTS